MPDIKSLFDPYERKARLYPGLVVIAPVIIATYLWIPSLRSVGGTIGTVIVTLGVPLVISNVVRRYGKNLESKLVKEWGALPSTIMLRHRDASIDPVTKKRYHDFLASNIPGISIPSDVEELADPGHADTVYSSAVKWLLSRTRDRTRYALLFEHNVNYGFARNLRGVKPLGLIISGGTILASAYGVYSKYGFKLSHVKPEYYLSGLVGFISFIMWFASTKRWVRTVSESFATELLASCDVKDAE